MSDRVKAAVAGPARERVAERLRSLLGPEGVGVGPGRPGSGGEASVPLAAPATDEETGAVLRVAGEEGWRVLPMGRGLGPDRAPGPEPDLILSTRRRTGVTRYEPADLTLTAEAGTTLDDLDLQVRARGQWLPLDPPGGPGATLGGVVAGGLGGPLALGFGRPREHVLGLTLVDGEGRILPLGGRVVKNVAGFDLVRMAVGSRGTLGVVTSLSLRLFPAPAADRTLIWERDGLGEAWELGRRLAELPLPVAALELVASPGAAPSRVVARVLGSSGAVDRITREMEGAGGRVHARIEGDETLAFFRTMAEDEARGEVLLRARTLPDRGGRLLEVVGGWPSARIALRPGTGELRVGASDASGLDALRTRARELGAGLRLLRAPAAILRPGPSADPVHDAVAGLERGLREAFDPRGILPGSWRDEAP